MVPLNNQATEEKNSWLFNKHLYTGMYVADFKRNHLFRETYVFLFSTKKSRSSWLNSALQGDEAVYWVSIGHYEAVAVGN